MKQYSKFLFSEALLSQIKRAEPNQSKKNKQIREHSPKILISGKSFCTETLKQIFNGCLIKTKFSNVFKLGDIITTFEK